MTNLKSIRLILIALLLTVSMVQAQVGLNKIAQSTMNFLQVGVSAKASGMGETLCGIGRGAESIFYNPAGLAEAGTKFDVRLYAVQWIADINYMAGAFSYDLGRYGTIGLSFLSVDYGDIYTTSLLDDAEKALYPGGYKDTGLASNVGAYAFGISYGRAISTQFLIAGNARIAGQNLGSTAMAGGNVKDNNASKLVFDAGVKYYTGLKSFRFGMAIRNFSSNIKREEINEQLPLTFVMGAAVDLYDFISPTGNDDYQMTLAVDFLHPNNYSERVNVGLEYLFLQKFALRGGYQSNQDIASWSAGVGLHTMMGGSAIAFDYSYSSFDVFDGVNRFSLGIGF